MLGFYCVKIIYILYGTRHYGSNNNFVRITTSTIDIYLFYLQPPTII